MLSHTIGFETTQSWTASVRETSRAESWISINPTSGDAGKHTITVTLTENETTESRQAVVIISCGGESANISITQRGVGQDEPEDPDNPNNIEAYSEEEDKDIQLAILMQLIANEPKRLQFIPLFREKGEYISAYASYMKGKIFFRVSRTTELVDDLTERELIA